MKKYTTTILSTHTATLINSHFTALGTFSEVAFIVVAAFGIMLNILKYDNRFNIDTHWFEAMAFQNLYYFIMYS